MRGDVRHVFVVGLDDFNLEMLERLPQAEECEFHPALGVDDIRGVDEYDMRALIEKAEGTIEDYGAPPSGVCAFYDFPATDIVPILAERFGLPGPSLESVVKCEHKYWSRVAQSRAVPENIPAFHAFDPFSDDAWDDIPLIPPYWVKPFKSFRGFLAFEVHDRREFDAAIEQIRREIGFMGEPFRYLLEHYGIGGEFLEMPEECLAESVIGGSQCTLEGYVYRGETVIYGVVDSVREAGRSSFSRYQYPSCLPEEVQSRMAKVARRAVEEIGLDNSAFNVEFFWDQTADKVWLLEINPRISQAHTWMFEQVHGVSHLQVAVDLALGHRPPPLPDRGRFPLAANFMLRVFEPGLVQSVPTQEEIRSLQSAIPGSRVKVRVEAGQDLEALQGQDMYSYELANIFLAAGSEEELLEKHERALRALAFEIRDKT